MPVSATIAGSAKGRADYDQALEAFSRPFMQVYAMPTTSDRSGFARMASRPTSFLRTEDATSWRYLDMSGQARYLSGVLRQTVEQEMAQEALALRQYDEARVAIKNLVEMPDTDAITSSGRLEGGWQVSNTLRKTLPQIFAEDGAFYARHIRSLLRFVPSSRGSGSTPKM